MNTNFLNGWPVEVDVTFRLLLAYVLGGIVGWDRERDGQPAGLRTHMMVATGSAGFTLLFIFGFAGVGILFLHHGWDSQAGCHFERRAAGVAANTDHHFGLKVFENTFGFHQAFHQLKRQREVGQAELSLQTNDRQANDFVAGSRNTFHFHFADGAHKQDFCFRVARPYLIGDGQGGKYMTASSTTRYDNLFQHALFKYIFGFTFFAFFLFLRHSLHNSNADARHDHRRSSHREERHVLTGYREDSGADHHVNCCLGEE